MNSTWQSSARLQEVQDPIIRIVGEWTRAHPGTISLGQGIVFYGPPDRSKERIQDFWQEPRLHGYQKEDGMPELLRLIREKLARENGITVEPKRSLFVTAGSNMAFTHVISAITDVEDEVILFRPFYFNHEMAIEIAGAKVVLVDTDENFLPDIELLQAAITDRTRGIVTVSPHNPTGQVYPPELLRKINDLCRERGIYHIHDEAYEYFVYEGSAVVSPASWPGTEKHTISLFSLSKAFGFASWRIGYMVIPEHLRLAVSKIQDTVLICPSVIAQYAAMGVFEVGKAYFDQQFPILQTSRQLLLQELEPLGEICQWTQAPGAMYIWIKLPEGVDSLALAKRLIEEYGVAVMPGITFGAEEPGIRISFGALTPEKAEEGGRRLCRGLLELLASG